MSTANGSANGAPLSPQTSYSASKSAMAAIFGPGHRYNTKEDSSKTSTTEPPSGIKGKGTADEPYDQGNAPEAVAGGATTTAGTQSQEPLSGVQGQGTKDEPYDQGNAGESTAGNQPINTTVQSPPEPDATPASASSTTATTSTSAPSTTATTTAAPQSHSQSQSQQSTSGNERGRTLAPPSAGQQSRQDRSVSPGTLDDGTHELCAGEKGGNYEPSRGLGRLANKMFGGK